MPDLCHNAAAYQIDLPTPMRPDEVAPPVTRLTGMVAMAVEHYSPFLPAKSLVFPAFAHAAPRCPIHQQGVHPPGHWTDETDLDKNHKLIAERKKGAAWPG